MSALISKLNEGGPFFMYPMMVLLFVVLALFIIELVKKDNTGRTIALLKSLGWFTAAWGMLGHSIGLITAFDAIQAAEDIAPHVLAGGLKIALLTPLTGTIVFIVARICIIVLLWLGKKEN